LGKCTNRRGSACRQRAFEGMKRNGGRTFRKKGPMAVRKAENLSQKRSKTVGGGKGERAPAAQRGKFKNDQSQRDAVARGQRSRKGSLKKARTKKKRQKKGPGNLNSVWRNGKR